MPAYFTRHARQRLFERFGEQFTEEEEAAVIAALAGEISDQAETIEADVQLATRPRAYRFRIACPDGAIVTILSTREWKARTGHKKAVKMGRDTPQHQNSVLNLRNTEEALRRKRVKGGGRPRVEPDEDWRRELYG